MRPLKRASPQIMRFPPTAWKKRQQPRAASLAGAWNVKAKNGSISAFDAASGKFTFAEGENGKAVNEEKLKNDIVAPHRSGRV